ncbi:KilA-N domain-containing protein [Acinetobacter bohemicus]|uniref:KilA-N domain-containing protein n=1 Tax=Acinetobacter bohemicus TaxID=1435036 RepID=UPI004041DC35
MKSTGTKKPCPTTNQMQGLVAITKDVKHMTTIQQNLLNPNNQPLVIGSFSIRQDEDGRYCLNDLHKASGGLAKHKPSNFIRNQQTQDLIVEIEQFSDTSSADFDRCSNMSIGQKAVNTIKGGVKQGMYVVEDLVYSYAMWISAKFHLMVIRAYRSQVMEWMIGGKQTISPEQCGILYNIVHTRAGDNKNTIVQMWSRLKNHFKYSASYRELRAIHFEDAKHYLEVMDLKFKTEKQESKPDSFNLDKHNIQGLAIHMIWVYKWWKEFGPAIRTLSPRVAGDIDANFIDGHSFATYFVDKPTRLAIDEKTKDYQWHASFKEKMGLDFHK